jgi:hypothetical protein
MHTITNPMCSERMRCFSIKVILVKKNGCFNLKVPLFAEKGQNKFAYEIK